MNAHLRPIIVEEPLLRAIADLTAAVQDLRNQLAQPATPDAHVLMDVHDLAALFHADERTVRRWVHEQVVPEPIKVGGTLRWRRRDVDAWLEAR